MKNRPKIAFYWASSCGGCEEALIDMDAELLNFADKVEIVFWPVAMDFKLEQIKKLDENEIFISFINGAIRNDEEEDVSTLLREKSQYILAFGSCAHLGGVPALANLFSRDEIFKDAYLENSTTVNPNKTVPKSNCSSEGKPLTLPNVWDRVCSLDQVIEVDYYLPGCPPVSSLVLQAIEELFSEKPPTTGNVFAPEKALCEVCSRRHTRNDKTRLEKIVRPYEIIADPDLCFLEQGIICCGPATRAGCEELCIKANMPCTGCFGPPPGVKDQGAKLLSAIASLLSADSLEESIDRAQQILDPAGTFFRYSIAASYLSKTKKEPAK